VAPDRPTGDRAFVGRHGELALISSCVSAASEGRAQVIWVEGEAGAGKTALVRHLIGHLPADFSVLRAQGDELAVDVSLAVASQLGPIVSDGPFAAGLELLELFAARQDAGPLAAVVEDLHWADTPSRQALLTVARRLGEDRVVIVVTTRPGAASDDGWDRFSLDTDHCRRITLGALTVSEVAELGRRNGVSMTSRDAERLHAHTNGHPLYVRTLFSELAPEQLAGGDGSLPAPRSLASTTLARLSELPPEARVLAAALAVVNQRTPLAVAGRIAGLPQPTRALEALLTTGFVTWSPGEMQVPVEFSHPLYRTAVYDDLSPTRRQQLHRAAAEILDPGAALSHRVVASDSVDDDLADEIDAAARREVASGALALAARYLLWASPLSSGRDRAEHRLLEAVRLLLADGQTARASVLGDQVEACREGPLRSLVLGTLAWEAGDAATAEQWLLRVGTLADHDGSDDDVAAAALARLGILCCFQVRGQDAIEAGSGALALGPTDPEVERDAWIALASGEAMLRGADAGLVRLAERLPASEAVRAADVDLLVTRGTLGFYAGLTMAAIADLRVAVRLARTASTAAFLPRAHLHLTQLLFRSGDWDEALVHAHVALVLVTDERRVWMEAQVHAALGRLLASRGEWDASTQHLAVARSAAAVLNTFEAVCTVRIAEAGLALARQDPGGVVEALAPLARSDDPLASTMFTSLGWWPTLVIALLDRGDLDAADVQVGLFEQAVEARGLDFRARLVELRARLALARGRLDEAVSEFERAISLFGPDESLLDRALLLQAFGRLLHARGTRKDAVDRLRSAHELLAGVNAEPFRRRAEADLAACGIRSAPETAQSPLALTDRERDVAALVARGMTNREVSAELYISDKAVEYHLRNIFGKLGISSRRDLRGRFQPGSPDEDQAEVL
jgi:DNA-binding CsgD family transcriptional regulator